MVEAVTYQCPHCNGQLAFDSASGKLACEYCGSVFDPEEIEKIYAQKQAAADEKVVSQAKKHPRGIKTAPDEDPIQTYLHNANWENLEDENLRTLNCSSCGAQLMIHQTTAVTSCPYCGNATVVPGQLADTLKPHYIIPFKFGREAALGALKGYYQGKPLLPNAFKDENHLEEIQGIYVPFWLYSGKVHASVATEGRNTRSWNEAKKSYTATDRYHVYREGDMEFQRVPVDGSTKMPDAHMDSIEPFDYSGLVPFSIGYLPGFLTDCYDVDMNDCASRMQRRVEATCGQALLNTVEGYTEIDPVPAQSTLELDEIAYALLPVWMLHTRWNGKDYLFAMNGQTGKFVGDLPIDASKMVKTFFKWFIPTAIIMTIIVYFIFGFGF